MKPEHLIHLVCPMDHSDLTLVDGAEIVDRRVKTGTLRSTTGNEYQIINFVPRFAPEENYADNFGFQWKVHARTQIDRFSNTSASRDRFFQETRWEENLEGELVLEAGSGAGRFTEHALSTGAMVVSFDYSESVDVNYELNGQHENLLLLQANIYEMPFRPQYFDRVFCFGVIQHTPDARSSFDALVNQVRSGGRLVFDVYVRNEGFLGTIKQMLKTKYLARRLTRGMEKQKLYSKTERHVKRLWPAVRLISRIPKLGPKLVRFLVVADNGHDLGLTNDQRYEWAVLDTFDWLSPEYDSPQKLSTIQSWLRQAPLSDTEAKYGFNGIEARGIRQ